MTVNVSSNFKERILGPESFPDIFNGGRILIFSGLQPASADYPTAGTLLAQVTTDGLPWTVGGSAGGLNFIVDGVWAINDPTQSWQLTASVVGNAGWFRLVGRLGDDNDYSFAAPRIDGSIGAGGDVDLILPTTSMTVGYTVPFQQFLFSFPPVLGA